jgi:hypothetical protein
MLAARPSRESAGRLPRRPQSRKKQKRVPAAPAFLASVVRRTRSRDYQKLRADVAGLPLKLCQSWRPSRRGLRRNCSFWPETSRVTAGPLSALLPKTLAQAPGGQDLTSADLTGRFVQSDRNAEYTRRACPESEALGGKVNDDHRDRRPRVSPRDCGGRRSAITPRTACWLTERRTAVPHRVAAEKLKGTGAGEDRAGHRAGHPRNGRQTWDLREGRHGRGCWIVRGNG